LNEVAEDSFFQALAQASESAATAKESADARAAVVVTTVIISSSRHLASASPFLQSQDLVLSLVPQRAVQSGSTVSAVHDCLHTISLLPPTHSHLPNSVSLLQFVLQIDAMVCAVHATDATVVGGATVVAVVVAGAGDGAGVGAGVGGGVGHTPPGAVLTGSVHAPPSWQTPPQKRQLGVSG
jgi:hypothetical protein